METLATVGFACKQSAEGRRNMFKLQFKWMKQEALVESEEAAVAAGAQEEYESSTKNKIKITMNSTNIM